MTCTTLIKKPKKCMKMIFLKKISLNNTKIFAKNTHWRVETQLSEIFANVGKSATEKQNKKKLKPKFYINPF